MRETNRANKMHSKDRAAPPAVLGAARTCSVNMRPCPSTQRLVLDSSKLSQLNLASLLRGALAIKHVQQHVPAIMIKRETRVVSKRNHVLPYQVLNLGEPLVLLGNELDSSTYKEL